ncbi:acetyltransferase [Bacillus sp. DX4.1]|uniref:acetyltransferase n=1 Tax=Bacillus sp. DX4.1 TaxID=3055867 RepID=UPI0025A24962|nr:acetyltransferase [Bacillus sp. DX4.1]MDM5190874.1 acetyltransferase [Bacillus sp. DX4.1]
MKQIALIGQGGHAKVITDMIHANTGYQIVAVFDDKYENLSRKQGVCYGPISSIKKVIEEIGFKLVIAIGNNAVRKRIVQQLGLEDESYETIIHPTAVVSQSASVGVGTVIMPNAVINADTVVESHVIVNTAAVIEHDNHIGDFAHISPNATLTGTVFVNEGTQVGAGAIVIPNRKIGEWSIIGAGATVIHDIPSFCTAVGSPARVIK